MTPFPKAPRSPLSALCLAVGLLGAAHPALARDGGPLAGPSLAGSAPAGTSPTASAPDVARARDLFAQLVAREAAFDPTTKQDLYSDSATFDFSLQYTDGTVAPIAMTIADVRKSAPQSMALARQQGIVETYTDPVFTALGDGRVRVDCRVTFSDGGPDSTMSQVMGPDPASGRFVVLSETVRMVEMPDPASSPPDTAPAPNAPDPVGAAQPT